MLLIDAITDICARAGLTSSQIDTSLISGTQPVSTPGGYLIERPTRAADALNQILKPFFIDACETDGVIRFVPRATGGLSAYQLAPADVASTNAQYMLSDVANRYGTLYYPGGYIDVPYPAFSTVSFLHKEMNGVPVAFSFRCGSTLGYPIEVRLESDVAAYYVGSPPGTLGTTFALPPSSLINTGNYGNGDPVSAQVVGPLTPSSPTWTFLTVDLAALFDSFIVPLGLGSFSFIYALAMLLEQPSSPPDQAFITAPWLGTNASPFQLLWTDAAWRARWTDGLWFRFQDGEYTSLSVAVTDPTIPQPGFFTIGAGNSTAVGGPESDLGLAADKCELVEQFSQEQDLPQAITVLYTDAALDYQQGKQLKGRNPRILTVATKNQVLMTVPFTLTADQARQIAEAALYTAWIERTAYHVNLWRALYFLVDPTDLINFVYEGNTYLARVHSTNHGQGGATALELISTNPAGYISTVDGAAQTTFTPATVRQAVATLLWLLDIPLLQDTDANPSGTGFYFVMSATSADWPGGALYESSDDATFSQIATAAAAANFGYATTALAAPRSPWDWDTVNSLTINMCAGSLAGDTMLNVLNGSNALLAGAEVIQFVNAVQNENGTYTVSQLLRGRRGTEGQCASHAIGETVIALSAGGVARMQEPTGDIGAPLYYCAVTSGQTLDPALADDFTLTGEDLMPYAPVGVGGFLDSQNNVIITWVRRTRIGGAWLDGTGTVPVSEDSEAYQVDILSSGGSVLRTLSGLTTPTAIYLASQVTTDFGSLPSDGITVKVYQISAQVGRGFAGTGIVPTPNAWPAPWPETLPVSGQTYLVNGS